MTKSDGIPRPAADCPEDPCENPAPAVAPQRLDTALDHIDAAAKLLDSKRADVGLLLAQAREHVELARTVWHQSRPSPWSRE